MKLVTRQTWAVLLGPLREDEAPHGLAGCGLMGDPEPWPNADARFAFFRSRQGAERTLELMRDDPAWPWAHARVVKLSISMEVIG